MIHELVIISWLFQQAKPQKVCTFYISDEYSNNLLSMLLSFWVPSTMFSWFLCECMNWKGRSMLLGIKSGSMYWRRIVWIYLCILIAMVGRYRHYVSTDWYIFLLLCTLPVFWIELIVKVLEGCDNVQVNIGSAHHRTVHIVTGFALCDNSILYFLFSCDWCKLQPLWWRKKKYFVDFGLDKIKSKL